MGKSKRALTEAQQAEVIRLYTEERVSAVRLGEMFDLAPRNIHVLLKAFNVPLQNPKLTEAEIEAAEIMFDQGATFNEIAAVLDRSAGGVRNALFRRGKVMRPRGRREGRRYPELSRRKHSVNDDAFVNAHETEEGSYFLGLMLTDGCVSLTQGVTPMVILTQAEPRHDIVYRFQQFLQTEHPVYFVPRREAGHNNQRTIRICSQKMADDLSDYGVVPNKTSRQTVDSRLKANRHFWRGVYDGDGIEPGFFGNSPRISLGSTSMNLADGWIAYARSVTGSVNQSYDKQELSGLLHREFVLSGKEAVVMLKNLYQDSTISINVKMLAAEACITFGEAKGW